MRTSKDGIEKVQSSFRYSILAPKAIMVVQTMGTPLQHDLGIAIGPSVQCSEDYSRPWQRLSGLMLIFCSEQALNLEAVIRAERGKGRERAQTYIKLRRSERRLLETRLG